MGCHTITKIAHQCNTATSDTEILPKCLLNTESDNRILENVEDLLNLLDLLVARSLLHGLSPHLSRNQGQEKSPSTDCSETCTTICTARLEL